MASGGLLALVLAGGGVFVSSQGAQASQPHSARTPARIVIGKAPTIERSIISRSLTSIGADSIWDVTLGDPPGGVVPLDGYPGDRWLYIEVPVGANETDIQVKQDWEAANLAGATRNDALAKGAPAPFGYSIIGIRPDGTKSDPVEIVTGALPDDPVKPIIDVAAQESEIENAAKALGLDVRSLTFSGSDNAPVVVLQTGEDPSNLIARWPTVLQTITGYLPETPWFLEIDDSAGQPLRALANSPISGDVAGWTRPDLRQLEVDLGHS